MSGLRWALRRFRQITPRERGLLALAAVLLPLVDAAQRRLPFRTWRRLLSREGTPRGPRAGGPSVGEIAWSVEVARKWLPGGFRCLPSAYAAHMLLHHFGYASEVHVGVRRDAKGQVDAHAWVVCDGRVVVGAVDDLAAFVPLPKLRAGMS